MEESISRSQQGGRWGSDYPSQAAGAGEVTKKGLNTHEEQGHVKKTRTVRFSTLGPVWGVLGGGGGNSKSRVGGGGTQYTLLFFDSN